MFLNYDDERSGVNLRDFENISDNTDLDHITHAHAAKLASPSIVPTYAVWVEKLLLLFFKGFFLVD